MAKPKVYLSHSNRDRDRVGPIYQRLLDLGFKPWWYDRDIMPGEYWQRSIERAILEADVFLSLVSSHWEEDADGKPFYATEIKLASAELDQRHASEGASGVIFIIPVRLDRCRVPELLARYKWIDLFEDSGWSELARAIRRAVGETELEAPEPPEELIQAFVDSAKPAYVYVGAGLSAPMCLPMWVELCGRLLDWAESRELFADSWELVKGLHEALEDGNPDLVADNVVEAARLANAEQALWDHLRELFIAPAPAPGPNHQRLRLLGPGGALTTNFDDLLERTFEAPAYTFRDTERLLDALSRPQPFVLKLYGTLDRVPSEPLIVATRQYEDEIAGNLEFSKFMEAVFVSRTLLFVGASLQGIEAYLRGIKFRGTLSRKHYALVAVTGSEWRARAESLRRRYQIEVLPYTLSVDHREVDNFLQTLLHRVRELREGPTAAPVRRSGPAQLAGLTLKLYFPRLSVLEPLTDLG